MEETLNSRRPGPSHEKVENKKQHDPVSRPEYPREKRKNEGPPGPLTRLNTSKANILMEIKDMKELKWPSRMKSPPDTRDRSKYCEFHRDHGHTTEDCQALQREIEAIIKRGLLRITLVMINARGMTVTTEKSLKSETVLNPLSGPLILLLEAYHLEETHAHTSKEFRDKLEDITFGVRDLEGVSYPHDDALVVCAIVANFEVKRILGFGGGVIIPEGIVELPFTLGSGNIQVTEFTPFQVDNTPMAYNIILGRPLLNKIQAIVSTFHLAMKFPTSHGIGVLGGD
ncbi:uncharacterized protein LOC111411427 [Olea europaea var. sylvestris]|uniref:uncharacterized protein LOC111411427 n=1 Tax=Olea europaea var. sylvestris TaxID=158386 RepID=UPI000C1D2C93|nr:uncharacterized protein LOC111411427 [Olea europaea var. sylvestris]